MIAMDKLKKLNESPIEKKIDTGIKVSIKQIPVPLLPHERDQSTENQVNPVDSNVKQAAKDIARGLKDTDRGEEVNRVYQKLKTKK